MFHIVLVEPEIPHNTGAAGRLALATGATLHLVEPLGFSLDDKHVRRTGLDYWKDVDVRTWPDFETFRSSVGRVARLWYLTTKGRESPWSAAFAPGDYLIFGRETAGLSPEILDAAPSAQTLRIPMAPGSTRSLNLATAIGITLYEAVRQQAPDW
ncbi:MAG: tRNA (cytidine(34)-2'-O)-methyltransferase [Luteolibacter sp.]